MKSNRTYFSYSQYATFKSSPKQYYEKYVKNKETGSTKYQRFGRDLMKNAEFAELSEVPELIRERVKSGIVEHPILVSAVLVDKDLYGILDAVNDDKNHFIEIKTGKHRWTKDQVVINEQMLFYALLIYLETDEVPTAELLYVETKDNEDGGVQFTGYSERFYREFTLEEILQFQREVCSAIEEIDNYVFSKFDVEQTKDERLKELLEKQKEIDAQVKLLKDEIFTDLQEFGNKYGESEHFNFTIAQRPRYKFSAELTTEIKELETKIKVMKNEAIKSGVAEKSYTEYLLIKSKS